MGVGLVMMKEESNEGGNECTQLPPCPGVETENEFTIKRFLRRTNLCRHMEVLYILQQLFRRVVVSNLPVLLLF